MPDRLILASASPRRRELLESAGLAFDVESADVDETPPEGLAPAAAASVLARRKADAVLQRRRQRDREAVKHEVVLAADTMVWLGGTTLAKPENDDDARRMLRLLSGRRHVVVTGYAILRGDNPKVEATNAAVTRVLFKDLSPLEIDAYVATGEPRDKAGAYAIQGRGGYFIRSIAGSYSNVVGLPLTHVLESLETVSDIRAFGLPVQAGGKPRRR